MRRIVHDGIARHGLGEGVAEGAEAIDDLRLAGEHGRRAGRNVVAGPGEALGQHLLRERTAAGVEDGHGAQGVGGTEIDRDLNRHQRARARVLGNPCGGNQRGLAADRHSVDADRNGALIVAVTGEHIGQAAQIGLGAPHQPLAVRRRLLAQAVEGRGVLQGPQDVRIVGAGESQAIGQCHRARSRRLLFRAEQAEQVEGGRRTRQKDQRRDTQKNATKDRRTQQAVHPDMHSLGGVRGS